MGDSKVKEKIL